MAFNTIFNELLEENELKQADLSRITGIPTSLISNYSKGIKSPTLSNAITLANAFGVSLDYLSGKTNLKNSPTLAEAKAGEFCVSDEQRNSDHAYVVQMLRILGFKGNVDNLSATQIKIAIYAVSILQEIITNESADIGENVG